ncbi:DUF5110 domain-containing protein [Mycoplasmatota bacterium]|nr:DUF5110 domain-containing protein [Mycoplasmatota bacterium]
MNQYILKQFEMKTNPQGNIENIIQGNNYRFTLLNHKVIRMEYSQNNQFEDRASQVVLNRFFPKVDFKLVETDTRLEIITDDFHLYYQKGKAFNKDTLKIRLLENNEYYQFGIKDNNNLLSTSRTLDGVDGKMELEEGLISRSGYAVIDDSKTLLFNEDSWVEPRQNDNLDFYYFGYGHNYKACIQFFHEMSGKTPLLPRYVFGNWWSRYYEYTEDSLKGLIESFEKNDIPLSVCVIDMDWHVTDIPKELGNGWTGYTWNNNLFPNPKGMLDYLKNKNLKVTLNLHPALGIRAHEDCYNDVTEFMGVDPKTNEAIEFDCADPKFMNAYFNLVHHPHETMGVDFWWIDWQQGETTKIEGLDPLWMLNHTHYLDITRNNNRSIIFSRWAKLGSHRYPIGFSGDTLVTWDSLDFQPYFTANAANIGYSYWSHDIGGHFLGKEEAELYTRWVQFGVFSPVFRLHSSKNPFTRREPWNWNEKTFKIVKDFMQLRHKLVPYLYTMSYRNYEENLPMIVPSYYECDDYHAYVYKNQYYFGTEFYVAPITKPMNKDIQYSLHNVWLPKGKWYDFFNYQAYAGEKVYQLPYQVNDYPVFAKAGAIIPLSNDKGNTYDNPKDLEIKIFPGENNTFTMFEDDSTSNGYLKGEFTKTQFELTCIKKSMNLSIIFDEHYENFIQDRNYTLHFVNINDDFTINSNISYDYRYEDHQLYLTFTKGTDQINFEIVHEDQIEYKQKIDINQLIHKVLFEAEVDMLFKEQVYSAVLYSKDVNEQISKLISIRNNENTEFIDFVIAILVNLNNN